MPQNRNTITYTTLDRLINMTRNIKEPSEDILEWVSSAWSGFVSRLPLVYRTYSYLQVLKAPLDFRVALNIRYEDLVVTYFQKDEILYLCLDKMHYEAMIENQDLKNYLNNKVNGVLIHRSSAATQPFDAVELKTFLSNCNSVKKVTFHDNYMTTPNFQNILKSKWNENRLSKKEKRLVIAVGDEELLLECLTQCTKIEIIDNLHIRDDELFFRFILGIEYERSIFEDNIHDVDQIVRSSKPSWPKLKSVDLPFYFSHPQYIFEHIHNLCFIILRDFTNAFPKEDTYTGQSPNLLEDLLSTEERDVALSHIKYQLNNISIMYLKLFPSIQLLGKPAIVHLCTADDNLEKHLDILCNCLDISRSLIKFHIVQTSVRNLQKVEKQLKLIQNDYPEIIDHILQFDCAINYQLELLTPLTRFLSETSNLQVMKSFITTNNCDIDPSQLPVCLTNISNFILETHNLTYYNIYIQNCMIMFPNIQNFSLILTTHYLNVNMKIVNDDLDFVKFIKNLKSFHLNFKHFEISSEDMTSLLIRISSKIDTKIELFYSVNYVHIDPSVQSELRNHGWHLCFD